MQHCETFEEKFTETVCINYNKYIITFSLPIKLSFV